MHSRTIDAEVVFNAAAYNQVDVAEKEPQAAFLVNALAVRNLALACRQIDAQLVHFSTDYVFDGAARHPYVEEDPTPSARRLRSFQTGRRTLRAGVSRPRPGGPHFGRLRPGGLATARGNFVELMLRLAASPNPIRVVEDHVASPTFAPLLAARTIDLVERNLSGLFHIGGGAPISWFQFARLIFEAAGLDPVLLATNEREYRTPARRPRYSALSNGKMERSGLAPMPPLREALESYFAGRPAVQASKKG